MVFDRYRDRYRNKYKSVCVYIRISFLAGPLREDLGTVAHVVESTLSTEIMVSKYCSPLKRTRASWRKLLIPELVPRKYKMILKHLVQASKD